MSPDGKSVSDKCFNYYDKSGTGSSTHAQQPQGYNKLCVIAGCGFYTG